MADSKSGRALAASAGAELVVAEERILRQVTGSPSTQGVLAVAARRELAPLEKGLMVSLHGIQDPGNVGAILRSAAAVEAAGVLIDSECADPWSLKAVRGAAGALWRVAVQPMEDPAGRLRQLQQAGYRLAAAVAAEGEDYLSQDLAGNCCVMIGSEGRGLPDEITALSDFRITVQYPGAIESLNASTSASILLFEALRQRKNI